MGRTLTFSDFQTRGLIVFIAFLFPVLLNAQTGVNIQYSNVTCFGLCNGSATAFGTGGTAPYQYQWSNGGSNAAIAGLCPGVYTVTVTDAVLNTAVDSVQISQPFAPLGVEIQTQNQICDIAPDGSATANPLGGTPPYAYLWNTNATTQQITGLTEGVYSVSITDINGCTATDQDSVIFWNEGIWLMDSTVNVLCFGQNTGFSHIGPMSGTPPYMFFWSNDSTTQDISNLFAGTYTVTVVDANGCSNSATVTVSQPDPLDATVLTTPASCGDPGSATVLPTGGVPPYSIQWGNDSTGMNVNAPAGQISVTVTDANGCTFIAGITIPGSNDSISITGQILNNAGCQIGGSVALTVSGGSGNYTYAWNTGDSTSTLINLPADTFSVTVTDVTTGCTGTASILIPMAPVLLVDAQVTGQATCLAGGSAAAVITGGTPPFVITWSTGDSTTLVSGLAPGPIVVTVVDSTGCTASDTIAVLQPVPPEAAVQVNSLANCTGGGGAVLASAGNGTPPYTFEWNTGDSTAAVLNLSAGTYTVIVTDSAGCADTASIVLGLKPSPTISFNSIAQATCVTPATIDAVAAGGTAPYTFQWNFGADTSLVTLGPGTYTVTVTDAAGCTASDSLSIALPPAPDVTIQVDSLANCTGGGGGATATATGGTPPYNFVWNNGQTTASVLNLSAGTFIVIVTDSLGCVDTASVTIGLKPSPTVSFDILVQAVCNTPASVNAVGAGGTSPYMYAWSTGVNTPVANLGAGTHTVTVTDAAGCTAVDSLTIVQPPAPNVTVQVDSLADCLSGVGGGATAVVVGGIPPFTFLWSNGDTTASAHNLSAGTFTVIVIDSTGCADTASVTIGIQPTATITFTILAPATCISPASVEAAATGGTPPYTYLWSTGAGTAQVNLGGGTFTLTVTDATGCTSVDSLTITLPPSPDVTVQVDSLANCSGGGGAATATATGGLPPYSFAWNNGATTATASNLSAGTYTVVVTDSLGCTDTASVIIGLKPPPTVSFNILAQATCIAPASVEAVAAGGTPPYTYQWSSGANTSTASLGAGTYTVTVTDAAGCTTTGSITVTLPPSPDVTAQVDSLANCSGGGGAATATGSGGTPPYTFVWSSGATGATALNLSAGTYTVTLTDALGCTDTTSVIIGLKPSPTVSFTILTAITCVTPASVDAVASGGTPPYAYLWSSGAGTSTASLGAGTYTVTVTDAAGCTTTGSITIALPPAPDVTAQVDSLANCSGGGGAATATGAGGTPPYTFVWSSGTTGAAAPNLSAGTYTVTLTDALGCTDTASVIIGLKPSPTVSFNILTAITCVTPASVDAVASGGTPPYAYLWSSGAGTSTASLGAGTYTVTVTDAAGCTTTGSITIALPPAPDVTAQVDSLANCSGGGGAATASGSGGTPPYTFVWSSGATGATALNLSAGTYTVTLTDALGCTDTTSVLIGLKPSPSVSFTILTAITCVTPASVDAVASGGTAPYTYLWSSGAGTSTASLGAGTYTVTVTDAAGCTTTGSITLTLPPAPVATAQVDSLANCTVGGGGATATATGGTLPYGFSWSSGAATASATNLSAGTYIVIVTDALGCADTTSVNVGQATPPTVSIAVTAAATCIAPGSATATPTGGTAPYSFLWSDGAIIATNSNLPPGTYTVTVTDKKMCTATGQVTVAAPPLPMVSIVSVIHIGCNLPGSATAGASGGTPSYTYVWDTGSTDSTANNLTAGTHTVTLTDAGGCIDTAMVTIDSSGNGGILIGDFVWYDNDQNGFQHPLETGVPNFPVLLIGPGPDSLFGNADDMVLDSVVTDSTGKYGFGCVTPGIYIVKFKGLPLGYEFAPKDAVNNDCKDSDANPNGTTAPITVVAGQADNICVDAGIHILCENVMNAGIICCNQTICEGEIPDELFEVQPPVMGSGPLEYLWMQLIQIGQAPPNWMGIPGATNATYQPGPLYQTSYFMRCVRRQGCITFLETNIITITVLPAGTGGCANFMGDFVVSAAGKAAVKVQWTTLPEQTAYLYTVERSVDKLQWVAVEQMMGYQDASAPNHYEVMDHSPANGMNYYRIRRQSAGGPVSMSDVRQIELRIGLEESLAVYPNPASQLLNIRNLMAYDTDARVELFTAGGARLHEMKIPAGTLQQFEVPVADLPQGIYLLRIQFGDGERKTLKVSKM